jgi:hypothetical protein
VREGRRMEREEWREERVRRMDLVVGSREW